MSNTKHTPGPWKVIIYKYDKDPKEIVTGVGLVTELEEGRYTEQIVDMILPDTDDDYIKEHEAILANAKLIAAAPEMLEALQKIMDVSGPEHEWLWQYVESLKLIKAAIKKATE